MLNGLQKSVQLLLVQDLLGQVVGLGDHCALCRILGNQVCAHRVFHSVVEHGMDAGEHSVRELIPIVRMLMDAPLPFQFCVHPLDVC